MSESVCREWVSTGEKERERERYSVRVGGGRVT